MQIINPKADRVTLYRSAWTGKSRLDPFLVQCVPNE